jgi:hypothetical protein
LKLCNAILGLRTFVSLQLPQKDWALPENKNAPTGAHVLICGEPGIRTLEALLELTHFPGVRLRPLGQLSGYLFCQNIYDQVYMFSDDKTGRKNTKKYKESNLR